MSLLNDLKKHTKNKHIDDQLDVIFNTIDDLIIDGKYSEINNMLWKLHGNDFNGDCMVGILTITFRVKHKLPYRSIVYQKTRKKLKKELISEDKINKILKGLY